MKNILFIMFLMPLTFFGQDSNEKQKSELIELDKYLFTEYAINKNTDPLDEIATDDFILIAAPGILESKKQAIDGVVNLDISSISVTVDSVTLDSNLGIVVGIIDMKGTIMKRPVPGKIRYSSTYIKENGKWRLKMRTMTPIKMKIK